MLPAATVLPALSGQMTAMQLAERLGETTPKRVVPTLNELREEGLVIRRITSDDKGNRPIARWRSVACVADTP